MTFLSAIPMQRMFGAKILGVVLLTKIFRHSNSDSYKPPKLRFGRLLFFRLQNTFITFHNGVPLSDSDGKFGTELFGANIYNQIFNS